MAQCATTALAGAVPRPCVRGARGRFGGFGPVPRVVSLPFPPSRPVCHCMWRAVPSGCPLPLLAGTPFHVVCAFCELRPVALLVVPACPVRVCALMLPRCPPPPTLGGVACAPPAVPALGAGRAVPRGPCPTACPAPVRCSVWRSWGGAVPSRFPPTWLGAVGVAQGRPRGGCLPLLHGSSGVRRSPSPDCPPRSAANGSVRRGGGGGGRGGEPHRPGSRPRLPQASLRRGSSVCAVLGAAGPPLAGSGQGGGVRAVHQGRLRRPRCPLTPGAAASSGGGAGPLSLRSASVRSSA